MWLAHRNARGGVPLEENAVWHLERALRSSKATDEEVQVSVSRCMKDASAKKDMFCQMMRIASKPLHAKRTGESGVLAHFHPFQIASLHQHSLSHQLLGVRQPFYTKKRYGWRRHLQPWRLRQQSRPDSIISSDSFFVVEHPRMTMRKKIKTCQPAAHCPLSIGLI